MRLSPQPASLYRSTSRARIVVEHATVTGDHNFRLSWLNIQHVTKVSFCSFPHADGDDYLCISGTNLYVKVRLIRPTGDFYRHRQ
jgi:hypothetical protein